MSGSSGGAFLSYKNNGTQITGSVTWSLSFSFFLHWNFSNSQLKAVGGALTFSVTGWTFQATITGSSGSGPSVSVTVTPPGSLTGGTASFSYNVHPPQYDVQDTITGSLTLTIPWEQTKTVSNLTEMNRSLPEDQLFYGAQYLIGGAWSYTFSATGSPGTASVSHSGTIPSQSPFTSGFPVGPDYKHDVSTGGDYAGTLSLTGAELVISTNGVPATYPFNFQCSGSSSGGSVTGMSNGSLGLTTNVSGTAHAVCDNQPPTTVQWDGLVTQEFQSNWGNSVTIDVNLGGTITSTPVGNGVYSASQTWAYQQITFNGTVIASSPALPTYFNVSLDSSWLSANNVPSNDGYMRIYDDSTWAVTTLTHAASTTADSFSSIANWTGTQCNISNTGGLNLTATGNNASAQNTSYTLDFRNYRYLRVNITANNAGTEGRVLTLTLADPAHSVTKQYSITLKNDQSAHDYDIDLCAPINAPFAIDTTDASWATPGTVYGMQKVTSITISGMMNNDELTVASLKIVRKGAVMNTFPGWVLPVQMPPNPADTQHLLDVYQYGNDGARYARLVIDLADGKQAMDLPHAIRPQPSAITTIGIDPTERLAITDFVNLVNGTGTIPLGNYTYTPVAQPGLAATAVVQLTSPLIGGSGNYYTGSLFAAYLTLDKPGTRASIDTDMTSQAIYAWPEYYSVSLFPGMVDPENGGNVTLRFTKRLYGSVHGLAITSLGPMAQVKITVSGGATNKQTVQTDGDGYFRSGPRAPSDSQTVAPENLEIQVNLDERKWRWVGFPDCAVLRALLNYFPFPAQWGDNEILGLEEWRHVPPEAQGATANVRKTERE
jgi:hypothetical protein